LDLESFAGNRVSIGENALDEDRGLMGVLRKNGGGLVAFRLKPVGGIWGKDKVNRGGEKRFLIITKRNRSQKSWARVSKG